MVSRFHYVIIHFSKYFHIVVIVQYCCNYIDSFEAIFMRTKQILFQWIIWSGFGIIISIIGIGHQYKIHSCNNFLLIVFNKKLTKTFVAENVDSIIELKNFTSSLILDSYWDCTVDWEIVVHVLLGSIQVYNISWIIVSFDFFYSRILILMRFVCW